MSRVRVAWWKHSQRERKRPRSGDSWHEHRQTRCGPGAPRGRSGKTEATGRLWVERDSPQWRRRSRPPGAKIYFLDEAGFRSEAALGRSNGSKGQTLVVGTTGPRPKVNARGAFWFQVYTGKPTAALFASSLQEFLRGWTAGGDLRNVAEPCSFLEKVAPERGLEPLTRRLTAGCSTIELLWTPKGLEG